MHKNMPATTWQALVHVFNFFTCLLDRGGSDSSCPFLPIERFIEKVK